MSLWPFLLHGPPPWNLLDFPASSGTEMPNTQHQDVPNPSTQGADFTGIQEEELG